MRQLRRAAYLPSLAWLIALLVGPALLGKFIASLARAHGHLQRFDGPEQLGYLWGTPILTMVLLGIGSIVTFLREDLRACHDHAKYLFWTYFIVAALWGCVGFLGPIWDVPLLPEAWTCQMGCLLGRPTQLVVSGLLLLGIVTSSTIIGIAGAQLLKTSKVALEDLLSVHGSIRRSFATLSVMLTLSVFATVRLQEAIHQSEGPQCCTCNYSKDAALAYGLILTAGMMAVFLPVFAKYHSSAHRLAQARYPRAEDYEKRQGLEEALGLTAIAGVEALGGALAPLLALLPDFS